MEEMCRIWNIAHRMSAYSGILHILIRLFPSVPLPYANLSYVSTKISVKNHKLFERSEFL